MWACHDLSRVGVPRLESCGRASSHFFTCFDFLDHASAAAISRGGRREKKAFSGHQYRRIRGKIFSLCLLCCSKQQAVQRRRGRRMWLGVCDNTSFPFVTTRWYCNINRNPCCHCGENQGIFSIFHFFPLGICHILVLVVAYLQRH